MILDKTYPLRQILEMVCQDLLQDNFCLYGRDVPLSLEEPYLVATYPEVVNDREVYPEAVLAQGLDLVYMGEHLIDVVTVALEEKPEASLTDLCEALVYYYEHDTFMNMG